MGAVPAILLRVKTDARKSRQCMQLGYYAGKYLDAVSKYHDVESRIRKNKTAKLK
jgi:hypothetical protein